MQKKYSFKLEMDLATNEKQIEIRKTDTYFNSMKVPAKDFAQFVQECNDILTRLQNTKRLSR